MLLQTVLDLKAKLRGIPSAASVGMGGFVKFAGTSLPAAKTLGVVLGVAPGSGGSQDYRIAVRTTRQDQAVSSYVNTLGLVTNGEIDVQHVGEIQALPPAPSNLPWRGRTRPLKPGYSVAHVQSTAGTIGAFVEKNGMSYILSNNHVLALSNTAQYNDVIVQPGPFDGGLHPQDSISRLSGWVPIKATANFVDAAIGVIDVNTDFDPTYNGQQLGVPVQAQIGVGAWKVGRTTGVTKGTVSAVALDDVPVRLGSLTVAYFDDQIEIQGDSGLFSEGGDSGSLILDPANNPFGLLFAGSTVTGKTYANVLNTVLQLLDAALLR